MKIKIKKFHTRTGERRYRVGFRCFPMLFWHWFAPAFKKESDAKHFAKCIMTEEEEARSGL